ncbi:hypothetical protein Tco_0385379 [Tanacetum coccineum]
MTKQETYPADLRMAKKQMRQASRQELRDSVASCRGKQKRVKPEATRPDLTSYLVEAGRASLWYSNQLNLQYLDLDTHEKMTGASACDRLGSAMSTAGFGQWRSPSESSQVRTSEDIRRKRPQVRVSSSSEGTSERGRRNGTWESKKQKSWRRDEDTVPSMADPDDILKISLNRRPLLKTGQTRVVPHVQFHVGRKRAELVQQIPRRQEEALMGFESLVAECIPLLIFHSKAEVCQEPFELLPRVKQHPRGMSTSAYEKPPPRTAEKATQTTGHRNSTGDNPMTECNRNNSYRGQGRAGDGQVTPLTMTPKRYSQREDHHRRTMSLSEVTRDLQPIRAVGPIHGLWVLKFPVNGELFTIYNTAAAPLKIATQFLSKSADKSLPLFKTLKKCTKKGDFVGLQKQKEAFTKLKQHIAALPTWWLLPRALYTPGTMDLIHGMDLSLRGTGPGAGLILTNGGRMEFTYALAALNSQP